MLAGHIWFPHFHFSLTRDRSQARRTPNGAGNSVVDDHTGHCRQVRAPFSSPPTPNTPRAPRARLCVSHSGTARLPAAKTLARTGCCTRASHSCQSKQGELLHSSPDVVQQVQKGGKRKINSPKQHHLTSAHPCHETKLLAPLFPFGTRALALPAQPGTNRGANAAAGPREHPIWTKRLDPPSY